MTDPDRLEKALPDLLQRSGWIGPEAQSPLADVPPEEQKHWEQLFEEPAEPVRRRFGGLSVLGATGLVAAALIAAVSFRTVLQSSQLKTAPTTTTTRKSIESATRPAPKKRTQPPEEAIPKQPLLSSKPIVKTPPGSGLSESTSSSELANTDQETRVQESADSLQRSEEALAKRRAGIQDNTIASKSETKKDEAPITDKQEDRDEVVKESSKSAAPPSAMSQFPSRLLLISAPGLDSTMRERFQEQLIGVQIQKATPGEVVYDLKVQDGRVREATFVKDDSSLQETSAIEALKQVLQGVTLPQSTNLLTRATIRIE